MLYGIELEGQLPIVFNPNRHGPPWFYILVLFSLCIFLLLKGLTPSDSLLTFIFAGCFCWLVIYFIAHLNVVFLCFGIQI